LLLLENVILAIFGGKFEGVSTWYTSKSIILGGKITINYARLFAAITTVVSIAVLYILFYKTNIGKMMRAAADDREGAALLGVNIPRVFTYAFGLSSVYATVAGASAISYVVTNPAAGTDFVIKSFIIVVFGGIGSIWGTIAGGLLLGLIENLGALVVTPSLASAFSLLVLIVIVIVRPTGLFGKR
jgi:branched-chain amino acid transport system permease protein